MAPDVNMLTAGRKYSIDHYPRIIHTLQETLRPGPGDAFLARQPSTILRSGIT